MIINLLYLPFLSFYFWQIMNKAIFLDRDGVINRERGEYTFRLEEFEINNDVVAALKSLTNKGYLLIIITNQSGIAKGIYEHGDISVLNEYMISHFAKEKIEITAIYYCPHHPDIGKCLCRKPDSLLLEKALARFEIDPAASYFIGDRDRDVDAAQMAGVNPVRIESNSSLLKIVHIIE